MKNLQHKTHNISEENKFGKTIKNIFVDVILTGSLSLLFSPIFFNGFNYAFNKYKFSTIEDPKIRDIFAELEIKAYLNGKPLDKIFFYGGNRSAEEYLNSH